METKATMLESTWCSIAALMATLEAASLELSLLRTLVPDTGSDICLEYLVEL